MRRFLIWWLIILASTGAVLALVALLTAMAVRVEQHVGALAGLGMMILACTAISAGLMAWSSGPTPPWFRKLLDRLR